MPLREMSREKIWLLPPTLGVCPRNNILNDMRH